MNNWLNGPTYFVQILELVHIWLFVILAIRYTNSSTFNTTLKEWLMANKTLIEKSTNVLFLSVFELDVELPLFEKFESSAIDTFLFFNSCSFFKNFFNDDLIFKFRNVKTPSGSIAVRIKFARTM